MFSLFHAVLTWTIQGALELDFSLEEMDPSLQDGVFLVFREPI